MDEKIAIKHLRDGDPTGLEYLVRKHEARALQTAWLILRDQALAEDVVSQSFLKAFQKIRYFREDAPFSAWFYRIVANLSVDTWRRERRLLPLADETEDERLALGQDLEGLEAALIKAETTEELLKAMDNLRPEHRATIVLRYFLGLSEKETADQLAKPLTTIKSWARSAREQLRATLSPAPAPNKRKES